MAAAERLFGHLAPYLVAPALAGLMVWCVYAIVARASTPWGALAASLLVGASPVTLGYALMPMSDVPAAAFWTLAWALALRAGYGAAVSSGLACAMAITVRPHLAPLAAVPLLIVLFDGRLHWRALAWSWGRGIALVLAALPGPLIVAWSQAVLYGDFRSPGYPGWEGFFRLSHIPANMWLLWRHVIAVQTPLIGLGLAAVVALFRAPRQPADHQRHLVVLSALLLAVLNYALYLPYLPYEEVYYVRFMLPALVALCVLSGVAIGWIGQWLRRWSVMLAPLAALPLLVTIWSQKPLVNYAFGYWLDHPRLILMGHYLREVLPANAVVFSALQSPAVAHYTGAAVIRFDLLDPGSLDRWIDPLIRRGYAPVLVIDDIADDQPFRVHITERPKYRWMPRAEFHSSSVLHYMVPVRRDRLDTDPGIVDVLR
jgi:MFS family permease